MIGANTSTQSETSCGCRFAGWSTLPLGPFFFDGLRRAAASNGRPARTRIASAVCRYDAPPATITNAAATSRAVNPYNRGAG